MLTYKFVYDRHANSVSITASASPHYGGVKTEKAARVACATKLDGEIVDLKARLAQQIKILADELQILEALRHSVYEGELPPPDVSLAES